MRKVVVYLEFLFDIFVFVLYITYYRTQMKRCCCSCEECVRTYLSVLFSFPPTACVAAAYDGGRSSFHLPFVSGFLPRARSYTTREESTDGRRPRRSTWSSTVPILKRTRRGCFLRFVFLSNFQRQRPGLSWNDNFVDGQSVCSEQRWPCWEYTSFFGTFGVNFEVRQLRAYCFEDKMTSSTQFPN